MLNLYLLLILTWEKQIFAMDKLQTVLSAHGGLRELSGMMMLFSRERIGQYTFYFLMNNSAEKPQYPFWMSTNPAMRTLQASQNELPQFAHLKTLKCPYHNHN